jgi:hypothetical protein
MSRQEKRKRMAALVADWQQSGLSQREYSSICDINHRTLSYWISRKKNVTEQVSGFIQINRASIEGILIRYPHGVEVVLPAQTPAGILRMLINL